MSFRLGIVGIILAFGAARLAEHAAAQSREEATVNAATSVLNEIMAIPGRRVPASLLAKAEGVAIVPGVVKGGFIVGVRHGRGVLLTRNEDKSWMGPNFIVLTGGSVGWQVGVQSTDVILVFKTRKSIDGLMNGKFTIGADAAVAAGPVGRKAAAATDARLKAEILSYSRSRGLFAGVSLDGSVLEVDHAANTAYYRPAIPNNAVAGAPAAVPASAIRLINTLLAYTAAPQGEPVAVAVQPQPAPTAVVQNAVPTTTIPPNAVGQNADAIRTQLSQASTQLQAVLDENWRRYLALPSEVYSRTDHASVESIKEAASRFTTVVNDVRYRTLSSRPEFTRTHQLLQSYLSARQTAPQGKIALPPPPMDTTFEANSRLPQ